MGALRVPALLLLAYVSSTLVGLDGASALPIVSTLRAMRAPKSARMFAGSLPEQPPHHRYVSIAGAPQRLLKKSQNPQWEDLGWAWGKRSDPAAAHKTAAQWDDLGWAWGKRSESSNVAGGKGSGKEWEDLGWAWGKRSPSVAGRLSLKSVAENIADGEAIKYYSQQQHISPTQFRAIQSLSKKNPDWHDLGWAWGR